MRHTRTQSASQFFDLRRATRILKQVDIVTVTRRYVRLLKRRTLLFGRCPLHHERTPSFFVSPERQTYHCFGCGADGRVISLVMRLEHLTYPEAVTFLEKNFKGTLDAGLNM
jgi:DNA primase